MYNEDNYKLRKYTLHEYTHCKLLPPHMHVRNKLSNQLPATGIGHPIADPLLLRLGFGRNITR